MKRLLLGFVLLALGFGLGYLYPTVARPPLVIGQDAAIEGVNPARATLRTEAGGFIDIQPSSNGARDLLIFYPGGLVRPQAYEWLGQALAPLGVRTVIPVFPFDLAVTDAGRASRVLEFLHADGLSYERVILAGHSLGGAMAARYAHRNPERVDALVLMAAYSADSDNLAPLPLPTLVLAAEHDGLSTLAQVQSGLARLPASARLTVIEGAVHSFFGRYGPQRNDGVPTVSRAQAEAQILFELQAFLLALRGED